MTVSLGAEKPPVKSSETAPAETAGMLDFNFEAV